MSLIKFELKEEHIKLIRNLKFNIDDDIISTKVVDDFGYEISPFGGDDLYEDIHIILEGVNKEFIKTEISDLSIHESERYLITEEMKLKYRELYNELPTALDVILFKGDFKVGKFKTKWYDRNWIEIS